MKIWGKIDFPHYAGTMSSILAITLDVFWVNWHIYVAAFFQLK